MLDVALPSGWLWFCLLFLLPRPARSLGHIFLGYFRAKVSLACLFEDLDRILIEHG